MSPHAHPLSSDAQAPEAGYCLQVEGRQHHGMVRMGASRRDQMTEDGLTLQAGVRLDDPAHRDHTIPASAPCRPARRAATPEPESEGRPRPQSFLIPGASASFPLPTYYDRGSRLTELSRAGTGCVAMEEQPPTLATHIAVETDAEGVAAATLRLRREFPDLDVGAVELPQAGDLPPGTRAGAGGAWRAGGQRCLVAAAYPFGWPRLGRPCLRRAQPPRGAPSPPAAVCYLRAHPGGGPRHLARSR
jgi:hypothetical protein